MSTNPGYVIPSPGTTVPYSYRSRTGTVAARVQALQNGANFDEHVPGLKNAGRAMTQANESGTITGRGRRETAAFASPAGRVSRDGTEGVRGDGRPPVGSIRRCPHPSLEEKEVYRLPSKETLRSRPVTSMDLDRTDQKISSGIHESKIKRLNHRKYISMENVNDAASEITNARSRLRTIAESKTPGEVVSPERRNTLAELGHLLDTAIGENAVTRSAIESTDPSGGSTPQLSTIRRWKSDRIPLKTMKEISDAHHGLRPQKAHKRSVTYSVNPIEGNTLAGNDKASHFSKPSGRISNPKNDITAFTSQDKTYESLRREEIIQHVLNYLLEQTDHDSIGSQDTVKMHEISPQESTKYNSNRSTRFSSLTPTPLKERLAIFENFDEQSQSGKSYQAPSDGGFRSEAGRNRDLEDGQDLHSHVAREQKTEDTTSLIEKTPKYRRYSMAVPRIISPKRTSVATSIKSSRGTHDTFRTAKQSNEVEEAETASSIDDIRDKLETTKVKPSVTWPFKWNLFNKIASNQPQKSEYGATDDIEKDECQSPARREVVRNRIQELLTAAREIQEEEQLKKQRMTASRGRRSSEASSIAAEKGLKLRPNSSEFVAIEQLSPAGLDSGKKRAKPIEEYRDEDHNIRSKSTVSKATTLSMPTSRLPSRKSTIHNEPSNRLDSDTKDDASPLKAHPLTPKRGRSFNRRQQHQPSPATSHHSIEQHFALTPGSSRSPSTGRGGKSNKSVKVELEVRDSPDRKARERGEKIVIVRANFEAEEPK